MSIFDRRSPRAADVVGEPLYSEVAGIAIWTGRWPQRRIACRSCGRKFLPYVVEPGAHGSYA